METVGNDLEAMFLRKGPQARLVGVFRSIRTEHGDLQPASFAAVVEMAPEETADKIPAVHLERHDEIPLRQRGARPEMAHGYIVDVRHDLHAVLDF